MKPILTDLYQKWMSDGELFTMMGVRHVTPWAEETDGKVLDLEYFGNRSGSKIVAPLLEKMLTEAGLSDEAKQNIVDLIWIRFGRNWTKLWETLTVEYNPIENYRMTEKGKIDHDGDQNNGVYGFNSTSAVPSGTGHDEYIDNTELTRSGNIGVTTSQQMIQSERDLWVWKFFEQVFQDVDTVLSIDVYGQSCLDDFSEYHGGGSEYVLPPATASTLGGVKIGEGLNVTGDGTISVQGGEAPVTSVNGKSGAVVLNYDDVGAPSLQEFQQVEDDLDEKYSADNPVPLATSLTAGTVLPEEKTDDMTQPVGIDELGMLWTAPGGGGGGVNYSTDEQDTGLTWIDGSPIYQKTYYGTASSSSNTTQLEAALGDGKHHIVNGFVSMQYASGSKVQYVGPYYDSANYHYELRLSPSSGGGLGLNITHGTGFRSAIYYVTIQYYKEA